METVVVNTDRVENYIDMLEDIKRNLNISNADRFYAPKIKNYIKTIDNIQNSIISDLTKLTTYLSEYTSDVKQIERTNLENEIYTANVSDEKLFEVKTNTTNVSHTSKLETTNSVAIDPTAYYYTAWLWAQEENIFWNEYNQFNPKETATRASIIDMLYTVAGRPEQTNKTSFSDINGDEWYSDAASWAKNLGISTGYDNGTKFGPSNNITRAQFITMLWRSVGEPKVDTDITFNDVDENKYYSEAVKWAVANGITTGTTRETFNPDGLVNKGQAITFLYRFMGTSPHIIDKIPSKETELPKLRDDNIVYGEIKDISEFNGTVTGDYFVNNIEVDESGSILSKFGYEAMMQNTKYLQNLVDNAKPNSIIKLPAGTLYMASGGLVERWDPKEQKTIYPENYVIHLGNANNIKIEGSGTDENNTNKLTILKPFSYAGDIESGLDMFYFNEHKDSGYTNPQYIENVDFSNFIIDSEMTRANKYTTAGKGFMMNLCKDCDWDNVVVRNTDGTGFGMDMVVNCTIKNCTAYNCGKNANSKDVNGASGFGIGTGYSEEESILIENCTAYGNYKYGFFFEHQGRFGIEAYDAKSAKGFVVKNCRSTGNYYNFGGERSNDVTYDDCFSTRTIETLQDIHFSEQSRRNYIIDMNTSGNFADVTERTADYYNACAWAYNEGISNGISKLSTYIDKSTGENYTDAAVQYANRNIGVGEVATRADFLDMLWRMKSMQGENNPNGWYSTVETGYSDVLTHAWYAPSIKWANDTNIISGYFDGTIRPNESITKAQLLTMLYRNAGSPKVTSSSTYEDVKTSDYFYNAVVWAKENNILFEETSNLNPYSTVTKEQAVMYLYNYRLV